MGLSGYGCGGLLGQITENSGAPMSPPCITPPDNHLTQPPTKVIFTLGIFFDGTANNAHNTTSHLEACVAAQLRPGILPIGYLIRTAPLPPRSRKD